MREARMAIATSTETVGLVQQFVERTGQLYSLPAAAAEVLRLTSEGTIDPRAIKACLESDPALTVRILRVVNSSLFGPSRPVTDLNQALTLLGIRPLKILILGFSLPKELFEGVEAEVLFAYWRHTLIKAVAARELSERFWRTPGDEPFLAGLVQDIGVLALIQQLGNPYQQLLHKVRAYGGGLIASELDLLGFDHLVLSARLLAHWKLPPGLCAAISVPPDTARIDALSSGERTLPQILHLADTLARLIEQPFGSALHDLLVAGDRYCGLTYETLQPMVAVLQNKVEDLAAVLSLELPEQQSYVDLLLTAHERLADETVAASGVLLEEEEIATLATEIRAELARATNRRSGLIETLFQRKTGSSHATPEQPIAKILSLPHTAVATPRAGVPSEGGLWSPLSSALNAARQQRTPLSLALFEIDRYADLLVQLGPIGISEVANSLCTALGQWTGQTGPALLVTDNRLALVSQNCSRSDAVEQARLVLAQVRPWSRQRFAVSSEITLSAGLATLEFASKNYPPDELIDAAQRCLSAARHSGGNTVKSIVF
jgi:HD-like signal output (HDOD) protein/GGDEF domain-containing protein